MLKATSKFTGGRNLKKEKSKSINSLIEGEVVKDIGQATSLKNISLAEKILSGSDQTKANGKISDSRQSQVNDQAINDNNAITKNRAALNAARDKVQKLSYVVGILDDAERFFSDRYIDADIESILRVDEASIHSNSDLAGASILRMHHDISILERIGFEREDARMAVKDVLECRSTGDNKLSDIGKEALQYLNGINAVVSEKNTEGTLGRNDLHIEFAIDIARHVYFGKLHRDGINYTFYDAFNKAIEDIKTDDIDFTHDGIFKAEGCKIKSAITDLHPFFPEYAKKGLFTPEFNFRHELKNAQQQVENLESAYRKLNKMDYDAERYGGFGAISHLGCRPDSSLEDGTIEATSSSQSRSSGR